ncbi:hypothetical protein EVAR_88839_1 [Eumeta japonica]|uniref:Uncharacterized protein n=1 Tax=Eumeta variegata TaxID=151549 RepID=A0A4C1Y8C4_EUMVA|nr:hypothetical protein EVAR_88839_1 [Eumeta japonica]
MIRGDTGVGPSEARSARALGAHAPSICASYRIMRFRGPAGARYGARPPPAARRPPPAARRPPPPPAAAARPRGDNAALILITFR